MPSRQRARISIDRGGTFTDCFASLPGRDDIVIKLLSVNSEHYKDAPTEGIRRILEVIEEREIPREEKLETSGIEHIRLSTTVATNALLERKGEPHALVTTKGFRDLLRIGNQSRPAIFDLAIRKPDVLYSDVVEVDERVTLVGFTSDPKFAENKVVFNEDGSIKSQYKGEDRPPATFGDEGDEQGSSNASSDPSIVRGVSGEAVAILKRPSRSQVQADLQKIYDSGIRALAVVLIHSFTFPDHENLIRDVAREIGFKHISLSSELMPMIKAVPRGTSTTADAYLTPVLQAYVESFFQGFDKSLRDGSSGTKVEFMASDGGLNSVERFNGLRSIISGPAGGVVGMALTSYDEEDGRAVLGFDMGGTSSDVSRYANQFEQIYETTISGVTIQSPQMDVNTVASGGSSRLFFRNGLFVVGPESASADPGPACYRKGGPATITDANVVTGRLAVEMFPKIFGPKENEGLDVEASRKALGELRDQIAHETGKGKMSIDEVALGFLRVANETMCRPIRALTEARGYSASKHLLCCFGGAGGQHGCSLARSLGIRTVLVHKHSSILSAYGMALADRVFERQEPCAVTWGGDDAQERVKGRMKVLEEEVRKELNAQGFEGEERDGGRVRVEKLLNLRYAGTDSALMTLVPTDSSGKEGWDEVAERFVSTYRTEFGFTLEKDILVDDVRVRGIGKSFSAADEGEKRESVHKEHRRLMEREGGFKAAKVLQSGSEEEQKKAGVVWKTVYFGNGEGSGDSGEEDGANRTRTPVVPLSKLEAGEKVEGPAILVDGTQTITLEPRCEAHITSSCVVITVHYDK